MKKILSIVLAVSLLLTMSSLTVFAYTGNKPQQKTEGTNLRVMSYNVLVDNDEELGGWSWGQALGNRGDKASAAIDYYRPDVIGFQECNYKWHVSLKDNLPDYAFVNADVPEVQKLEKEESLGKKDWMCTTMMYNTTTLTLIENELIGYSVNYWGCIQRMRYISMALFEIKATGERFVFTSTHFDAEKDDKGKKMRNTQAGELADRINYYRETYGYPIISTGDYNSNFSDEPIQAVVTKAGMTSHENNRGGIDYILYSPEEVESKYFAVINDSDLAGASDHQPIMEDMKVSNHEHEFSGACDAVCEHCAYTRTITHVYDDGCDADCNLCGATREDIHAYDNACDTDCNLCGAKRSTTHDYLVPNCTDPKTCKICGATEGEAYGHTYSERKRTDPSCTEDGSATYKCIGCSHTYTETLKATGHDYAKATCTKAKTCKNCGLTSGKKLGHKYSNDCDTSCNTCKAPRKVKDHTYESVTKKATATADGYTGKKCTKCDKVINKTVIYKASKVSLSKTSYTYNGKAQKPTVTVKDSKGKTISKSYYTVTYASGRKNVGVYKVTVKFKGKYSGTKTLTFTINPVKTTVKATAAKKSLKLTIGKKSTQVTGYQIQYSTSKSFKSYKTKTVSSYKTTSTTLTGLSAKKTYYVRVRTYKTVNGKKYYSGWSTVVVKKTK